VLRYILQEFVQRFGANQVPVGLFGLAMNTTRVLASMAASIAGRSCPQSLAGTTLA